MDKQERAQWLQTYIAHMINKRKPWAEAWESVRECARPALPWKQDALGLEETTVKDLIAPKISDNAAGRFIRILAAGLHSGLTPPSRSWFSLRIADDDLMEYGPVKNWLFEVEKIIYSVFARSNFYPSIHAVYGDLAAYCSGCLSMESVSGQGLAFNDVPTGVFAWDGDAGGRIHTLARFACLPFTILSIVAEVSGE
jgi:hypothetical protein